MNSQSPLAELLVYIAAAKSESAGAGPQGDEARSGRNHALELPAIDYFRRTWSKVSTNRLLRESRQFVPENAGPLNSSQLVHRSLALMHDVSPDYLHHLLLYVDGLSWMEQLKQGSSGGLGTKAGSTKTGSTKAASAKGGKAVRRAGTASKGFGRSGAAKKA